MALRSNVFQQGNGCSQVQETENATGTPNFLQLYLNFEMAASLPFTHDKVV